MDFKNNFNKRKYKESINNIKNIKNIFDKIIQGKKYQDIINEDNTDFLNKILEIMKIINLIKMKLIIVIIMYLQKKKNLHNHIPQIKIMFKIE